MSKQETVNVGDSLSKTMPSLFGTTEGQVQFNIHRQSEHGRVRHVAGGQNCSIFFSESPRVLAAKAKVEQSE